MNTLTYAVNLRLVDSVCSN